MIRRSDKQAMDLCGRRLRGCEVRRVLSVFARIRRAHVRYFNDLMFGSVVDNQGFQGIENLIKRPIGQKENKMKASISGLECMLATSERNEIEFRGDGKDELADLEASNAADYRQGIAILKAASNGPIWPEPKA